MSTQPKPSSKIPTAGQQRQQANILLLRLQWLIILLLIIALAWLYVSQQRFQKQVNERFQSSEQLTTRVNEMSDRLFANTQQVLPHPDSASNRQTSSQAQNQLNLLRIQIQAADSLLANDNDKAAIDLLKGLQWQLSQKNNEIAPALTSVIKQGLSQDIEHLQAQSMQPSSWQLHNVAIQNIQEFLHNYKRGSVQNQSLNRQQLGIHEVIMILNLAIQASNMREQDQLTSYLEQARSQLQTLSTPAASKSSNSPKLSKPSTPKIKAATTKQEDLSETDMLNRATAPRNIAEVIMWLDKLIADTPTSTPLVTAQILAQPNRQNDN